MGWGARLPLGTTTEAAFPSSTCWAAAGRFKASDSSDNYRRFIRWLRNVMRPYLEGVLE